MAGVSRTKIRRRCKGGKIERSKKKGGGGKERSNRTVLTKRESASPYCGLQEGDIVSKKVFVSNHYCPQLEKEKT